MIDPDIVKYSRLQRHLNGSTLENALIVRKETTVALLSELFGEDWRPGYQDFVRKVKVSREQGRMVLPLLALGVTVPGLSLFAHFLVADEVLKYKPPVPLSEELRNRITKVRPR